MSHDESAMVSLDCPDVNPSTAPFAILVCLHGIIAILSTVGNLLVLLSVYKSSALRTVVSNYFIASLAAADFLVGILVCPLYIALLSLRLWVSDHLLYKMENFLWIQSLIASTYNLCAITVDRWLAVTRVYSYPEIMTERRACFIIAAVWLFSVSFASLSFLVKTEQDASLLWISCALLTVGIPLALLAFCYFRIFQIIRRHRRSIAASIPSSQQVEQVQRRKEILKNKKSSVTVGFVVVLFFLLFTPNLVFSSVEIASEGHCQKLAVYRHWLWGISVAYFSSALNPFIYAVRSREYRTAFKRVLKCS